MRTSASLAALSVLVVAPIFGGDLITNGGFETGNLNGWTVMDEAGGSGTTFAVSGTVGPESSEPTVGPKTGTFYAMTDQTGPGAHVLIQSFVVPPGTSNVTLSFDMFVNSYAAVTVSPAGLEFNCDCSNQHARVDLLTGSALPFDTTTGVLRNFYMGADPGANPNPYTHYSFDITGLVSGGGTFQIRFAEADNQNFFNLGFDNVSIIASGATTTCPVPTTATWGSQYGSQLVGSGGTGTGYVWSVAAGSSIAPLTLSASGLFSGNISPATGAGPFNFTLAIADSSGSTTQVPCSITLLPPVITIACPASTATVGLLYSAQLVAMGSGSPGIWSLSSGSLAPLALSGSGLISGTPTAAAAGTTLTFTIHVQDNLSGGQGTQQCSIVVQASAVTFNCTFPGATAGVAYSANCTATKGTAPFTWSFTSLPTWLAPNTTTGTTITLSGTPPSSPPTFTFTVILTDSSSPTNGVASLPFTITVTPPPFSINCNAPTTAAPLSAYSASCTGSGGVAPYTWTFATLPSFLTPSATTGTTITISGTVASNLSSFSFTVTGMDSTSPTKGTASKVITVTIVTTPPVPTCTNSPATLIQGVGYSSTCTVTGGVAPYTWSFTSLPSWLTPSGSTGSTVSLSGTAAPPPGAITITVTVTDSRTPTNQTGSTTVVINVQSTVTITPTISSPNQVSLSTGFSAAAPSAFTGVLSLTFAQSSSAKSLPAGYVDPAGGFPVGGNCPTKFTCNFTIAQGASTASTQFSQGTVAGTWTATITALSTGGNNVLPSQAITQTVNVAAAAPVIDSGTATSVKITGLSSTGFTVTLTGSVTTRDVISAHFVFNAANGGMLSGSPVDVPFNGADQTQWFSTPAGQNAGGTFGLQLPFAYSGDTSALGTVTVTLIGSGGTSAPVTGGQ